MAAHGDMEMVMKHRESVPCYEASGRYPLSIKPPWRVCNEYVTAENVNKVRCLKKRDNTNVIENCKSVGQLNEALLLQISLASAVETSAVGF